MTSSRQTVEMDQSLSPPRFVPSAEEGQFPDSIKSYVMQNVKITQSTNIKTTEWSLRSSYEQQDHRINTVEHVTVSE